MALKRGKLRAIRSKLVVVFLMIGPEVARFS